MKIAIITGSSGLVGSEAVKFFSHKFDKIIGIDNNQRANFFGEEASTTSITKSLQKDISNFLHVPVDIRDKKKIDNIFSQYNYDIKLVIHTAAQPSHDLSAEMPIEDFTINAIGTLNLLEATKNYSKSAPFIFTSTNKVYGDRINYEQFIEGSTRFFPRNANLCANGIDELTSIDVVKRSPFGVSKTAADILVQEYGHYFKLKTVSFRCGCITGPRHKGTELHGFLAYLIKCIKEEIPYTIYGYNGKQVRDNIHSNDLIKAMNCFYNAPTCGEVYNMGGGIFSNCSILEAIDIAQTILGKTLSYKILDKIREADHKWWISDIRKFMLHYPWTITKTIEQTIQDLTYE